MKLFARLSSLLLLAAFLSGCSLAREPAAKPAGSLRDLQSIGELQARFNQDVGDTRVILLVSPT
ncbi:MAG TPA: hypothetical protein VEQ11_13390 [Chloroflexota bacterium]|nr:hypothetical protein [Chloroflexota bacterium]